MTAGRYPASAAEATISDGLLRVGPFGSSPYNFVAQARAREHLRQPLHLIDVTLREGQQAAEVAFGPSDEIEFARALGAAGVRYVQVGYAGADDASIRRIHEACPDLHLAALVVGWKGDALEAMRSARDAGADVCSVLFRSADSHLEAIGHTRDTARARVRELVEGGRRLGYPTVIYGSSFATQADLGFLRELYPVAVEAGADVISLADSLGTAKPEAIRFLVEEMRDVAPAAGIRLHMHNDYGLALANTLAGIEAGADWVEVTVNGLGERSGNCCLEELVLALEGLYGVETAVDARSLCGLSQLVARLTGAEIPPMKPVVGGNAFSNKLEIHVQAVAKNPGLMEPYDPSLVGNRRSIKLGRGTGPTGARLRAAELGLELREADLPRVVAAVNERAIALKRSLTDEEFKELMRRR